MRQLLTCLLLIALSGCSTVDVTSRQFIPKDAGKLSMLKQAAPDYQVDNIEFKHPDGAISRGIFVHKPDAQFTVLYFMGSGVRIDVNGALIAKPFVEMNANFISYDYHDFGRSDAPESAFGLPELNAETLALYDHVRATTNGKLVVHGHSFGSFVAATLAKQRPLDALVLEGTGTSAQAYADNMVPWYGKPFVRIKLDQELLAIDNRAALRAYQDPVLIISGVNDVQTPLATARELFDGLSNPHKRFEAVKDAGHMNAMTKPETRRVYQAFVSGVYE
ncbi:prolyl oligopeptidase family serine peptidase [Duganella sp. FT134W]|uniref:Prolyl oligopeptidase family serine peptidase n=1 Tax=Duganella margarita TaxID=2692170 RepID=A0A7X4H4B1_9BURK|nr:alpha/beta hydrolase [Duganella margarita]MYM75013.1 prolyl oligopeptidase family serine peptidase [Duganella margarita]